jgi:hypothetical protein
VAAAPCGRTQTRRCRSWRPLAFRIQRKRSRTCFRSGGRAGASPAPASRGGTSGRTSWSPRTLQSCPAESSLWDSTHVANNPNAWIAAAAINGGGFDEHEVSSHWPLARDGTLRVASADARCRAPKLSHRPDLSRSETDQFSPRSQHSCNGTGGGTRDHSPLCSRARSPVRSPRQAK